MTFTRTIHEIEILFDGPPGPQPGRFIEVNEPHTGQSIRIGEWLNNQNGTWSLIIPGTFTAQFGTSDEAVVSSSVEEHLESTSLSEKDTTRWP